MIRSLRKRHRLIIGALSIFVPATFALGIATRRTVPELDAAAATFSVRLPQAELWRRDDLWENQTIGTRILNQASGQLCVELTPKDRIVRADVLAYWLSGQRKIESILPDDAILLGSFSASTPAVLTLPPAASKGRGTLLLYSLADHEIIAVSKPFVAAK